MDLLNFGLQKHTIAGTTGTSKYLVKESKMKVKIKKLHPDAVIPTYAREGDAGMDLTAIGLRYEMDQKCISYNTGIAIEIPQGYVGLLFPRSSNCKKDLLLSNSVGVIDSGYRGEIKLKFRYAEPLIGAKIYDKNERIGQLIIMPYPQIEFEEAEELSKTERGDGGYGSTGK